MLCTLRCGMQVETLLDSIPKMFANAVPIESCGGAALKSAIEALKVCVWGGGV